MLTLLALTLALSADPVSAAVTLTAEPAPLHGTMLTPQGEVRAVAVILPGSGPTDRDGNGGIPGFPVRGSTYRLLAEGLAERGIATVRIDKRGIGESAAAQWDEAKLRFDDLAVDARAWAAQAAEAAGRPCAWLVGHSEGALVALAATREDDDRICGLVLLAGAGRPAGRAVADQLAGLPEPMKAQALAGLAELEAGRETANVPGLEALLRPSVQPYLISWFALDPAKLAAAYEGPMLIGQGSTDLQIPPSEAALLAAAQPRAETANWDGVNHMLKVAPADRAANMATYGDPALPLAPGVVEDVARFILAR